ncbi:MAG: 50S ribosomal protein L18 [bacterium]|nr:50S ribosomal protein L18 [bacterium]
MKKKKKRAIKKSTEERLRLRVYKSNKNISAQIIDDTRGITIVSETSLKMKNGSNKEGAKAVGVSLAKKAEEKNVKKVFFDRGISVYKGRVKELAEAARENGLQF